MSLVLDFLPEAFAEVECVVGDYEAREVGLGARFRSEVERACRLIAQNPGLWRLRPQGFRRVNLAGFPYYIAFITCEQQIVVVAVAHPSRHPDYFKIRVS